MTRKRLTSQQKKALSHGRDQRARHGQNDTAKPPRAAFVKLWGSP